VTGGYDLYGANLAKGRATNEPWPNTRKTYLSQQVDTACKYCQNLPYMRHGKGGKMLRSPTRHHDLEKLKNPTIGTEFKTKYFDKSTEWC